MKLFLSIFLLFVFQNTSFTQNLTFDYSWLSPKGGDNDSLIIKNDPVYGRNFIIGMGDYMQEKWPSCIKIDTSINTIGERLEINGNISSAIPDGNGGFFIAGNFTQINGVARTYVAQIDQNNQLTSFNPTITYFFPPNAGKVDIKLKNNILYIGGTISTVNGQTRHNLAAINIVTGVLLPWNPDVSGNVYSIEIVNNKLIVGGDFATISGQSRNNIASFNLINYTLENWNPNPDQLVWKIKSIDDKVYISGHFSVFDGVNRLKVANIDTASFSISNLNLTLGSDLIYDFEKHNSKLYMVGAIGTSNFLEVDLTNNSINANFLTSNNTIKSINKRNNKFYITGDFTQINNIDNPYYVEYDIVSYQLLNHDLNFNSSVNGLAFNSNETFIFGTFDLCRKIPSNYLNCFDEITGQLLVSPIQTNGEIYKLSIDNNYLCITGDFTEVNGVPRNNIAVYDLQNDTLMSFNPNISQGVANISDLKIYKHQLYYSTSSTYGNVNSGFNDIHAIPLFNDDSLRMIVATSFDYYYAGWINGFEIGNDSIIYVYGAFNIVNNETRASFAEVNMNSFQTSQLNLELTYNSGVIYPGHSVHDMEIYNDKLIIADQSDFTNGTPIPQSIITVDLSNNYSVTTFPFPIYGGYQIDLFNNTLRVGSDNGYTQYNISNNTETITNPINSSFPNANTKPEKIGNNIFCTGNFTNCLNTPTQKFAVFNSCDSKSVTTVSSSCSYTWNGNIYESSGLYTKFFYNQNGCDSIAYLNLTIENSISYQPIEICGTSYTSNLGVNYTQSGLYEEHYTNTYNCDSLVYLNLKIYPVYDTTVFVNISASQYTWTEINQVFTTSGVYSNTFQSINGCDSIVHLSLTFIPPFEYNEVNQTEITDGWFHDVEVDSSRGYAIVGGQFSGFIQKAGYLQELDSLGGSTIYINNNDEIFEFMGSQSTFIDYISDGNGGYFVCGQFFKIGDSIRSYYAHYDSNWNLTSWKADSITPLVPYKLISNSNYIFALLEYKKILKIDKITGIAVLLNVNVSSPFYITDIESIDNSIIIVGSLNTNKGVYVYNLSTDLYTQINISTNTDVVDVHIDNNKIYLGGSFTSINGSPRNRIARFNYASGTITLDTWNPNANNYVSNINTIGTLVIVTGGFTNIGGEARNGTACINKTNNLATSFNPGLQLGTCSIFEDKLVFSSNFNNVYIIAGPNSGIRSYIAAFDTTTFDLSNWNPKPRSQFKVKNIDGKLIAMNVDIMLTGITPNYYIGFKKAHCLAYYDLYTHQRINGSINLKQTDLNVVNKIFIHGDTIYMYGDFRDTILNIWTKVAAFNAITGEQYFFSDPIINGKLLSVQSNSFYVMDAELNSGIAPTNLTRFNTATNSIDNSFNYNFTDSLGVNYSQIYEIKEDSESIYVVGDFDMINGQYRFDVARINKNSITLDNFNPTFSSVDYSTITDLEIIDEELFFTGFFTDTNNSNQNHLIRMNKTTGEINNWISMNNLTTFSLNLEYNNNFFYLHGDFSEIANLPQSYAAVFMGYTTSPLNFSLQLLPQDLDVFENDIHVISNQGLNGPVYQVFDVCRNDYFENQNIDTNLNSTVSWHGNTYDEPGTYYYIESDTINCDTLYMLNLFQLNDIYIDSQIVNSCIPYYWNQTNINYYTSGVYYDTISNSTGLDTISILDLTIQNLLYDTTNIINCDLYIWPSNNQSYFTTGFYSDTLISIFGCDSIVFLNLTIIPSIIPQTNTFSSPSSDTSCNGQLAITTTGNPDFEINIDGGAPFSSSGYSLQTNLCPGIHELSVIDFCGDTVTQPFVISIDSNFVFNNPFIDSIALDSLGTTITNCDIYYNSIDTAFIDSLWATGNQVNVIWNIVDSNGSNLDTTTFDLMNGSGVYWLQLSVFCPTKSTEDYFTVTQAIYFGNGGAYLVGLDNNEHIQNNIGLFPNPTNSSVTITFNSTNSAKVKVFDTQGKFIQNYTIISGETISMENLDKGVYLVTIEYEGNSYLKRIIKQ